MPEQIKSKQRVADHGEVFTAEREVKAMCNLVAQECDNIFSKFLEPACGDGNFLTEILARKLKTVRKKYGRSPFDYERNAIIALSSIYGVDILADNAVSCRERLFAQWNAEYTKVCKGESSDDARRAAKTILSLNIVCGNALSLMKVDENQQDTDEPIIFPEWSFPSQGRLIQRKDFRFDVLLKENSDETMYDNQYSIFDDSAMSTDYWLIDPTTNETIPKPVAEYPLIDYRRLGEDG